MRRLLLAASCSLLLLGLAPLASADDDPLRDVPHVRQKGPFSGEACVEMWCKKLGKKISQEDVFDAAGVNPAFGRACSPGELVASLRKLGFTVEDDWRAKAADGEPAASWKRLEADLGKGLPSIVYMLTDAPLAAPDFRLVLGFDAKTDEVVFHDPSLEAGASRKVKKDAFLAKWPTPSGDEREVVRIRVGDGTMAAALPRTPGIRPSDYAIHVIGLDAQRARARGAFTLLVEPPFVVLGDEAPERVRAHAVHTVRWAVSRLKQDFFEKEPDRILDVWLFGSKESYEENVVRIFQEKPSTSPYGYYSPRHGALIMNIATGGGTLVHEIVHPFVAADFPGCPTWLNEGLGSLFEQSCEKEGHIRGLTNWRLAGLQKAIAGGTKLPSFETLAAMSQDEFYGKDRGTNYAQARYLLHFMQEKGILVDFWKKARAARKDDPTCYATLKKVLGEDDMEAFQKKWEERVSKLTFP